MSDRPEKSDNVPASFRVKALTLRAIVIGGVVLLLIAAGSVWLLLAIGVSTDRLDIIRTAGTLVVGAGGAVALLLAARRQRSTELELQQKYEAAADARNDATERRITELYIKAADQLGSDKAPVRLAGLYALERLAQDTPRLRQTIVNVICAYLRMPYTPPAATAKISRPLGNRRKIRPGRSTSPVPVFVPHAASPPDSADVARQEREVRLTAQNILAAHVKPSRDQADTFWDDIDLDLTDATLMDFNLSGCRIHIGVFVGATFTGTAGFEGAQFTGHTVFQGAQFGNAGFKGAQFTGHTVFQSAQFTGYALFQSAQFTGHTVFEGAQFMGHTLFDGATFTGNAVFEGATFMYVQFNGATFTGTARFADAEFGYAVFEGAQFTEDAVFHGATFTTHTSFTHAEFERGVPPEVARFVPGAESS